MTKLQTSRRRQSNLVRKVRWAGYTAAAAATYLGGHETAEAAITHVNVDPDVTLQGSIAFTSASASVPVFDIFSANMDGIRFQVGHAPLSQSETRGLAAALGVSDTMNASTSAMLAGFVSNSFLYARNLAPGAFVSSEPSFLPGNSQGTMAYAAFMSLSQFTTAGEGYLGVKFNAGAGTQYGWIRVEMSGAPGNQPTVTDYAFGMPGERVQAGVVPEPGSLGLLAIGAAGLMTWRRKRLRKAVAEKATELSSSN